MNNKRKVSVMMLGISFLSLYFVSCYKDVTIPREIEITREVTFSGDIVPLLNKSCNNAGCHSSGGVPPNLTADNAFNALSTGGYLDTSTPENSELYLWMTGNRSLPMPTSGPDPEYNALVLAWIKQGANNN
jgi:hypothetical protein